MIILIIMLARTIVIILNYLLFNSFLHAVFNLMRHILQLIHLLVLIVLNQKRAVFKWVKDFLI